MFPSFCRPSAALPRLLKRRPLLATFAAASAMSSSASGGKNSAPTWPTATYQPRHPAWPYTVKDFVRMDESSDDAFYGPPRFVTHIDDHAIACLRKYYDAVLPEKGNILDFCSSWISHYPQIVEDAVKRGEIVVIGMGMNEAELQANPVLQKERKWMIVRDLNATPDISSTLDSEGHEDVKLDAATCVVSIDYLTKPKEILDTLRGRLAPGAMVHLIISNRCFPTKAVGRWLNVKEEERLRIVGDYLHFAGYKNIEILTIGEDQSEQSESQKKFLQRVLGSSHDPLWVVKGRNPE